MAVDLNYGIGVEGKNLVLKTLGRVYVKVKDRKYELVFRPEDIQQMIESYAGNKTESVKFSDTLVISSLEELNSMEYPGDNIIIISQDGYLYFTSNGQFVEIPIKFLDKDLVLDNLTINRQIIFSGGEVPLVINTPILIPNLNADLLDGKQGNEYAVKKLNETIDGNWTFKGIQTFENAIGNRVLQDTTGQQVYVDFQTGIIRCNRLEADKIITDEQEESFNTVSGIGQEVWIGVQTGISNVTEINEIDDIPIDPLGILERAINSEQIPGYPIIGDKSIYWDIDWWCDLLFETCDLTNRTYTLKDFNNTDVWNEQNAKFAGTNYSLSDFQNLIDLFRNDLDISNFTGDYYRAEIGSNIPILSIVPNMLFKDNEGHVGRIVTRTSTALIVQMLNQNNALYGDKVIIIGTLCRNGGIVFEATNPSLSIIKNPLDKTSHSVYFGELSKIDSNKSGIGVIFEGTYPTNLVTNNTIEDLTNYQHISEININNSYLKWGNGINVFNEDGSGYLSKGQARWTSNRDLIIEDANIINPIISSKNVILNSDGSGNIGSQFKWDSNGNITFDGTVGSNNYIVEKSYDEGHFSSYGPTAYCDFTINTTSSPGAAVSPGTYVKIQLGDNISQTVKFRLKGNPDEVDPDLNQEITVDILPNTIYFFYCGFEQSVISQKSKFKVIEVFKYEK